MPVGLGGGGSVGVGFEAVMGTYVPPTVFVPVLSEGLKYTETKYYSEQIRQESIVSDVKAGYYHVEGDIQLEVDPNNIVHWLYASRHIIAKTGAGPFEYTFTPGNQAVLTTGSGPTVTKTLSITVVRNNVVFGYAGCVVGGWEFTVEDGVLKCTMNVIGLSEAVQSDPTEAWIAPQLYGADAHLVEVGASAAVPTFAANVDFNGFTFRANYNAEARNNLVQSRAATYIFYGITEAEIESELDFLVRGDYDNMVNNTTRAVRLSSLNGGATFAAATSGIQLQGNRVSYDAYDIGLEGMGDLVVAGFTGRCVGIAGGKAYQINLKSPVSIT